MRILTWNLWGRNGPWEQRLDAIAATLAEVGPDVCGFQEVSGDGGWNMAEHLAGKLGMHWCWAVAHRHAGREVALGNAVLSRWPIAAHVEMPLPTDDPEESRVALYARVDTPGGTRGW